LRSIDARVAVVPYRRQPLTEAELAAPVHVLSGGETSSFSDDSATRRACWELTGVLQRAWHGRATVIGICLGAQLLSRAISPELPRCEPVGGMEAGMCAVTGPQGSHLVAQLHYEQIHPAFAGVTGVEITYVNAHSCIQGFRWGPTVHGYQFHPEWGPADMSAVLRRYQWLLAARQVNLRAARASIAAGTLAWSPRVMASLVVAPAAAAVNAEDVTAA
jgi:GMP synthase-like glutamine amidotransferase